MKKNVHDFSLQQKKLYNFSLICVTTTAFVPHFFIQKTFIVFCRDNERKFFCDSAPRFFNCPSAFCFHQHRSRCPVAQATEWWRPRHGSVMSGAASIDHVPLIESICSVGNKDTLSDEFWFSPRRTRNKALNRRYCFFIICLLSFALFLHIQADIHCIGLFLAEHSSSRWILRLGGFLLPRESAVNLKTQNKEAEKMQKIG